MKIIKPYMLSLILSLTTYAEQKVPLWEFYGGKSGPSGWRCHVIQSDPKDDGPDGINVHDWDGDGITDLFVNFEEGGFSRLYFNPGPKKVKKAWSDFIEF